jgi:alkanesulfonate monooxygenase SsuD/methylene tetrahydromethanopterin reductase-like flavin-dependent oxidoreductase (luciferase family)
VRERALFELYASVSGRPHGEGMGVLRDVVIADSDEEAQALWRDSGAFVGAAWFAPFGFDQGMSHPETGAMPDIMEDSLVLVGSPDTVSRQLERLLKRLPAKWLFAWTYNGLIPHEQLKRSIERFATEVMPRFGGLS